jgi:hypothetical protein
MNIPLISPRIQSFGSVGGHVGSISHAGNVSDVSSDASWETSDAQETVNKAKAVRPKTSIRFFIILLLLLYSCTPTP